MHLSHSHDDMSAKNSKECVNIKTLYVVVSFISLYFVTCRIVLIKNTLKLWLLMVEAMMVQ